MESNPKSNIVDNGDKSFAEWPTLLDVCSNVKQHNGGVAKNSRSDPKRPNTPDNADGDDSAKENEESTRHLNGRGGKKKGSRQKWVPVPIAPPPYRKRGTGRFNSGLAFNDKKKDDFENLRGRGTSRFRGKRGRGFSQSWKHREETSRGEAENDADCFQAVMYYDPFTHNQYASATRRNELKKAIRNQIEYYFSEENLVKDFYMRRRMDSKGYVPLTLVAGFHRVQSLTMDFQTVFEAIDESDKLEVLDGVKVRPVVDPLKWPITDFYGLRPDVPDFIPGQPYFSISSVIESMQNFSFYADTLDVDEEVTNGIMEPSENHFDIPQNTPVEAAS